MTTNLNIYNNENLNDINKFQYVSDILVEYKDSHYRDFIINL